MPPIPPLSLPPQFSAAMGGAAGAEAIFLVKPGPCLALKSQNTLHRMPCVHESLQRVCNCLFCEIVRNVFFFLSRFSICLLTYPCLTVRFLSVVSISCLLVCGLDSALPSARKIHCLQQCLVPLFGMWPGSAMHGRCPLCVSLDMNARHKNTVLRHR